MMPLVHCLVVVTPLAQVADLDNLNVISTNKAKADKLVGDFLTRHAGTRAAAKVKKAHGSGKRTAD
jgi:hypothetical protein